ncbi:subtilisin-like serine peptidase [Trypanosoma vivax]|nr:subtilisin-like serine peptidase [Trypanosoma vivax]
MTNGCGFFFVWALLLCNAFIPWRIYQLGIASLSTSPLTCGRSGGAYIVMLDTFLHPEAANLAASYLKEKLWWLNSCALSGAETGVRVHHTAGRPWQDFLTLRVSSSCYTTAFRCTVCDVLSGMYFNHPHVGRVTLRHAFKDVWLSNQLTPSSPQSLRIGPLSQGLYPRHYLQLNEGLKWSGRGVKVALLDNGLDPLMASPCQHHPTSSRQGERKSCLEGERHLTCISFVPGVPCENSQDSHGTFIVSLVAANISLPLGNNGSVLRGMRRMATSSCSVGRGGPHLTCVRYLGLAPGSSVRMFRVFDDIRRSRASWLIAALNAALQWRADVVSLAFGGANNMDYAFSQKIRELTSIGAVVVAAAGNKGPEFGSLQSPADQLEVIAVGSLGTLDDNIVEGKACASNADVVNGRHCLGRRWVSQFSGRGPSTTELPFGAGRSRPDILAIGENVVGVGRLHGDRVDGVSRDVDALELQLLDGTTTATAIVVGIVALCVEALRNAHGNHHVNAALIRRLLVETAVTLVPNRKAFRVVEEAMLKARGGGPSHGVFGRADASPNGINMAETLFHYRNVLQHSRMSQGGGEVCPYCALSWVEQHGTAEHGTRWDNITELFASPDRIDTAAEHHLPGRIRWGPGSIEVEGGNEANASLLPCLYNWPYCEQPLFPSATPIALNVSLYYPRCPTARLLPSSVNITVTNGTGLCSNCSFHPGFIETKEAQKLLFVRADPSPLLIAHSGWVSLFAFSPPNASSVVGSVLGHSKSSSAKMLNASPTAVVLLEYYDLIIVNGQITLGYTCEVHEGDGQHGKEMECEPLTAKQPCISFVSVPFRFSLVRRPLRARRVGIDVSHQWFYPPDFVPRDDAHRDSSSYYYARSSSKSPYHTRGSEAYPSQDSHSTFEYESDHPHTNMAPLLLYLRRVMGVFVEHPLGTQLPIGALAGEAIGGEERRNMRQGEQSTLQQYYRSIGALLLIDTELPLLRAEREAIASAVQRSGLHVLLITEWYSDHVAHGLSFYDSLENRLWSPICTTVLENQANGSRPAKKNSGGTAGSACAGGLMGGSHVPSVNALLHEVTGGALQLEVRLVVDGELVLPPACPSMYHSSVVSRAWELVFGRRSLFSSSGAGSDYRYFGRINSAGAIRWPPESHGQPWGRSPSYNAAEINGTVELAMVCGVGSDWRSELWELTKVHLQSCEGCDDAVAQQASDVMRRVDEATFTPIFGFVGVDERVEGIDWNANDEYCKMGTAILNGTHVRGRLALFTDSSGLSMSPFLSSSLRAFDRFLEDVELHLLDAQDKESSVIYAYSKLALIVSGESNQPSLTLGLIHDFLHFLHTGFPLGFISSSSCRIVHKPQKNEDIVSRAPNHFEGKEDAEKCGEETGSCSTTDKESEDSFKLLFYRLVEAAPHRVAVAERIRFMLAGWGLPDVSVVTDQMDEFEGKVDNSEHQPPLEMTLTQVTAETGAASVLLLILLGVVPVALCFRRSRKPSTRCLP